MRMSVICMTQVTLQTDSDKSDSPSKLFSFYDFSSTQNLV